MDYINIIEITDRNAKILFDNEKYPGNKRVKLIEGNKEKNIYIVTFEEAKKIVFKERYKINFIQIESENVFNKDEFVLLTFFENFAYFSKDLEIYSQKDRYLSIKNEKINIFAGNGVFHSNVEFPKIRKELLEYKTILPYIFNKSGFSVENKNGYLSFKSNKEHHLYKENEKIVLKDNKISMIKLENIEEIEEKNDKREFPEKEFEIMFEIDSDYVIFMKENGKFILNSYDYCFSIVYEPEKKEISHYYNDYYTESNEMKIFQESIETIKKIIKKYSNDNFNEVLETFLQKIEEKIQQIKEEERKEQLAEQNFETEFEKRITEINI